MIRRDSERAVSIPGIVFFNGKLAGRRHGIFDIGEESDCSGGRKCCRFSCTASVSGIEIVKRPGVNGLQTNHGKA